MAENGMAVCRPACKEHDRGPTPLDHSTCSLFSGGGERESESFWLVPPLGSGPAPKFRGGLQKREFIFMCTACGSCKTTILNYKCCHDG